MPAIAGLVFGLILGFVAGQVFWATVGRWLGLVLTSTAKHGGDFLGPPRRRLIAMLPFAAVLHPGLWLVLVVLYFTVRILTGRLGSFWTWTAVCFYSTVALLTIGTYLRMKRGRSAEPRKE
jgi:hypothetical protein